MLSLLIIIILSYLAGSIPTAIIVSKSFYGFDIRTKGSKNAGGTNVFRVLGWKPGLIVMLIDVAKGIFATLVISKIVIDPIPISDPVLIQLIAGMAAIAGHIWTIFANFKGGKGVGTAAGVFIALYPIAILICFVIWLGLVLTTRIVAIASMLAAISLPIVLFIMKSFYQLELNPILFGLSIILALLIVFTHRSNIKRLIAGTENRFKPIWKKKSAQE
ncbi:glycerol-3-phosphate 1-O-acyltransferase PlsY [candidate division KSB1 bacterium]|nr:glycerol-3-phosphate 1-O-acyltransferase PlsY [candidate division KSB1 bacterium]